MAFHSAPQAVDKEEAIHIEEEAVAIQEAIICPLMHFVPAATLPMPTHTPKLQRYHCDPSAEHLIPLVQFTRDGRFEDVVSVFADGASGRWLEIPLVAEADEQLA